MSYGHNIRQLDTEQLGQWNHYYNCVNICNLLWNQCACRFFHNTHQTFLAPCTQCTDHLCNSCHFTDVNPHFSAPGCWYYFKINSDPPNVMSSIHEPCASNCDVTITDCSQAVSMGDFLLQWCWSTVYPKKYAHGFCFAVLCCGYTLTNFPISIRLTSLALWQSNDCPSASKATLMNMDKCFMWIHYERLRNHNKAKHNKTVCIFLGIYCKWFIEFVKYTRLFHVFQVSL